MKKLKTMLLGLLVSFTLEASSSMEETLLSVEEGNVSAVKNSIQFTLEKVTDENRESWQSFPPLSSQRNSPTLPGSDIAWVSFHEFASRPSRENEEIWIAYARPEDVEDVEMFFTVITDTRVPVTTHMGICRSPSFPFEKQTKGLSIQLHGFAAAAMKAVYPDKRYMYTAPLATMGRILLESLPHECISSVGGAHGLCGDRSKKMIEIIQDGMDDERKLRELCEFLSQYGVLKINDRWALKEEMQLMISENRFKIMNSLTKLSSFNDYEENILSGKDPFLDKNNREIRDEDLFKIRIGEEVRDYPVPNYFQSGLFGFCQEMILDLNKLSHLFIAVR